MFCQSSLASRSLSSAHASLFAACNDPNASLQLRRNTHQRTDIPQHPFMNRNGENTMNSLFRRRRTRPETALLLIFFAMASACKDGAPAAPAAPAKAPAQQPAARVEAWVTTAAHRMA